MRILLINAPPIRSFGITGQIYPPLGILYLASYARQNRPDFDIKAIDGYADKPRKLVDRSARYQPDVIGVSFTSQAATGAYRLIDELKDRIPKAIVVAGGPHPTALPGDCFDNSCVDIVAIGEGEETFLSILDRAGGSWEDLASLEGTAVRQDGSFKINPHRPLIRDLDRIPFPARDLLDVRKYPGYMYKKRGRDTSLLSARGCPFDCVYCSNPVWKNQKPWFRLRSPKNVVDEMVHIIEDYGIHEIFDETDEFNGNREWAKSVCDEIIRRDLDMSWKAQMRVDNVDEELVNKLTQSGFWMGLFGLESANPRTLIGIDKRQTLEQVQQALSLFRDSGVQCFGLFMAFNTWEDNGKVCFENKADSLRTLEFIKELIHDRKIHFFGWSMTTPYPGSKLHDIALRHNLINPRYAGAWEHFDSGAHFVLELPGVSTSDWLQVMNAGKRLQARLLFTSGAFNLKALPLYAKKAWFVSAKMLRHFAGKLWRKRA